MGNTVIKPNPIRKDGGVLQLCWGKICFTWLIVVCDTIFFC